MGTYLIEAGLELCDGIWLLCHGLGLSINGEWRCGELERGFVDIVKKDSLPRLSPVADAKPR